MKAYVLDTSALLCYLWDEKKANEVKFILDSKSAWVGMHRVNLGEIYYGILKKEGKNRAVEVYGFLIQYPISFVADLSDPFLAKTAQLKVDYHMGFADSFAAATAILNQAILVTKDTDFKILEKNGVVKIQWV